MSEHTYNTEVTVTDWDEEPYPAADAMPAVSAATWRTSYSGSLRGTGVVRVLLTYTGGDPDDPKTLRADYLGYEKIEASVGTRHGSFVLRVHGSHGGDGAVGTGEIVPDSGTGDFVGVTGTYAATASAMTYPVRFVLD
jgi:hypothetical protein